MRNTLYQKIISGIELRMLLELNAPELKKRLLFRQDLEDYKKLNKRYVNYFRKVERGNMRFEDIERY